MAYLDITVEGRLPHLVLRLCGELDLCSEDRLRRAVDGALAQSPRILLADLAGLCFADCAGLRVLLQAHRRQAAAGNLLLVRGARPPVLRLMQLTGADARLHLIAPGGPPLARQPPW